MLMTHSEGKFNEQLIEQTVREQTKHFDSPKLFERIISLLCIYIAITSSIAGTQQPVHINKLRNLYFTSAIYQANEAQGRRDSGVGGVPIYINHGHKMHYENLYKTDADLHDTCVGGRLVGSFWDPFVKCVPRIGTKIFMRLSAVPK